MLAYNARPREKVEKVAASARRSESLRHAFLLDALEAEQLQGVTVDVTEVPLTWQRRAFVLIDAPGHKEFLRNMISGAAHADAAFLLIDAGEGVQEQSYRHAYLLSFLGVRDVAVIVSKMDVVGYSQEVFDGIRKEYTAFLETMGVHPIAFIPVSARAGDKWDPRLASRGTKALPAGPSPTSHVRPLGCRTPALPVQDG